MTAAGGPAGTARVPAGPFVHRETVRTATGAVHVAWTSVAAGNLA
ncbi:copper oxidase, partial [Xanthomonas citri pv. citri]|nr:copper oxidase [Xanthomonas citri pv. citri]